MSVSGGEKIAGKHARGTLHKIEMRLHSIIAVFLRYPICRTSIKSIFPTMLSTRSKTSLETQECLAALVHMELVANYD